MKRVFATALFVGIWLPTAGLVCLAGATEASGPVYLLPKE